MFHAERQTRGSNFAIQTTLGQACNVVNVDKSLVNALIDFETYRSADWFFLGGPGFGYFENQSLVLMNPNIPEVAEYSFFQGSQNVGSGFTLEFNFRLVGPSGHGFALLIQNSGIVNLNGGASGPNLGVKNMGRSVAVVFDACPNFPTCGGALQLSMHFDSFGGPNSVSSKTRTVFDENVLQNWADGMFHNVKVFYYGVPDWFEVYVDNSLRLVQRGFNLQTVLDRNAFIGFASSSSSSGQGMRVEIKDILVRTVRINFANTVRAVTREDSTAVFVADGRSSKKFTVQMRDACNAIVTVGGLSELGQGRLVLRSSTQGRRLDQDQFSCHRHG